MALPDTKAVLTAEERAKAFLDRYGLRFKGGDQFRVHYGSGLLETMLTEEFHEAVEAERAACEKIAWSLDIDRPHMEDGVEKRAWEDGTSDASIAITRTIKDRKASHDS